MGKSLTLAWLVASCATASLKPSQGQGFSHPKVNTILINTYSEKQILKFRPTDFEGGAHNISLKIQALYPPITVPELFYIRGQAGARQFGT